MSVPGVWGWVLLLTSIAFTAGAAAFAITMERRARRLDRALRRRDERLRRRARREVSGGPSSRPGRSTSTDHEGDA